MRKYSTLQALYKSFYSADFYRDVIDNWSFWRLVSIMLYISMLTFILIGGYYLYEYRGVFSHEFSVQIPTITVKNGELTTPENRPYLIKIPNTNKTIAIIDTSGQYDIVKDLGNEKAYLILNSHYSSLNKKVDRIPENRNFTASSDEIMGKLYIYSLIFIPFIYIVMVIFYFIYTLLTLFLLSIPGKLIGACMSYPYSYSTVLKLTVAASIPATLLYCVSIVLSLTVISFEIFSSIPYCIVTLLYLVFAINKTKMPGSNVT